MLSIGVMGREVMTAIRRRGRRSDDLRCPGGMSEHVEFVLAYAGWGDRLH